MEKRSIELNILQLSSKKSKSPAVWDSTELLGLAKSQADLLLRNAREEAKQIREQARIEGYQVGAEQVAKEALSQLALKHELLSSLQNEILDAFVLLTRRILGHEVAAEVFAAQLQEAFILLRNNPSIKLCVHPEEMQYSKHVLHPLQNELGYGGQIEVVAEPELQRHTARWIANGCSIISSLDTHLERIIEHIKSSPLLRHQLGQMMAERLALKHASELTPSDSEFPRLSQDS